MSILRIKRWFTQQNKENRDRWVEQIALSTPRGLRVLDLGAGGCPYRRLFDHCEYRTQDFVSLKPGQLTQGGYGNIDFVCDAAEIPAPSSSFDVILCTEVLEHVPEPEKVIQEIARLLRPGGVAYLSAPLGAGLHQEPYHFFGGFTPYWYQRVMTACGFAEIVVTANGGSFMHFSQWCIWLAKTTRPGALPAPWAVKVLMIPLWLIALPVLAGFILVCRWLDRYDAAQQFTIGYHVAAIRQKDVEGSR